MAAKLFKTLISAAGVPCPVHRDVGRRFGRLRALQFKRGVMLCVCDCGNFQEFANARLRSGAAKACTSNGLPNHTREWLNEKVYSPDMTIDEVWALLNPKR